MTKISVIVPVLNGAGTLERSLQSCLNQTLTDIEILVIDDGSTDATAQIALQMAQADGRVRLISLDRNYGVSHARNVGLNAAKGEWIAIFDADDWIEPVRFETMLNEAERLKADIVIDNLRVVEADSGRVLMQSRFGASQHAVKIGPATLFEKDSPFAQPAIGFAQPLCKTAFLNEKAIRYNETYPLGEDFVFLAEGALHGGLLFALPSCGYVYRVRRNAFWTDRSDPQANKRQYDHVLVAAQDLFERFKASITPETKQAMQRRIALFQCVAHARELKGLLHRKKWLKAATILFCSPSLDLYLLRLAGVRLFQSLQRFQLNHSHRSKACSS